MSETPARIEPGQTFCVEYADGKSVEVVCLGLRKQKQLAAIVRELMEMEGDPKRGIELFDLAEQSLRLAMPEVSEDFLDTIDAEAAIEIATRTLGKQSLSADEQKK